MILYQEQIRTTLVLVENLKHYLPIYSFQEYWMKCTFLGILIYKEPYFQRTCLCRINLPLAVSVEAMSTLIITLGTFLPCKRMAV
ncbi:ORF95 [White spot syndrome virus]|uniref:Wsv016 n=3 Tax=White spot syndrome virus TaxID=342409 RepID=Q8VBE5_WSSVS|nr:wsv016 [Shrimp white spot syndrome virus]AFX59393.1 wsv016 [White spot syndrome virus]AAL33020.1 wsv016 [Shrimp white spot syndrome virus]AAL88940.1 WSSV072 [Shrimp white spot syndrome virus]ATU83784.1 ORF95 [White spot syndrome virus]AWQ60206.1 wsv016 [Shrimp white spot syndrome virus]